MALWDLETNFEKSTFIHDKKCPEVKWYLFEYRLEFEVLKYVWEEAQDQ